jgi:hypothetical protein
MNLLVEKLSSLYFCLVFSASTLSFDLRRASRILFNLPSSKQISSPAHSFCSNYSETTKALQFDTFMHRLGCAACVKAASAHNQWMWHWTSPRAALHDVQLRRICSLLGIKLRPSCLHAIAIQTGVSRFKQFRVIYYELKLECIKNGREENWVQGRELYWQCPVTEFANSVKDNRILRVYKKTNILFRWAVVPLSKIMLLHGVT